MKKALALGCFDGIHKGHKKVLSLPDGYHKTVVTFKKPPKAELTGERLMLMSADDKSKAFSEIGIDSTVFLDFQKVKDTEAEDFLRYLKDELCPDYISFGFNYKFGKSGKGDAELLKSFCLKNGIEYNCVPPVTENGETVCSTEIRNLLKNGEIKLANKLLFKPFSYKAEVISGDKRGRTLGFPTVNQRYPEDLALLKFGVYKTKTVIGGNVYPSITDIGIRPTFKSDYIISETFIKNFRGDLYGQSIRIIPCEFLREEIKFSSEKQLSEQIKKDIDLC